MRKKVMSFTLVTAIVLSLAACRGESAHPTTPAVPANSTDSKDSSEQGKAQVSDVIKVALSIDPPTLDPLMATAAAVRDSSRVMYEGLFELDKDYLPKEQLCEKYTVDDKHQEWVFTLRKGVKFHNGKEMKAEDAAASLNRWAKLNTAVFSVIKNGEQFEAVDEYTVKLSLQEPALLLLNVMTSPAQFPVIIPKEVAEAADDTGVKEYIGTGPCKFVEWKQSQYILYEKFDEYKGPGYELTGEAGDKEVYFKQIYYYIVTDSSIRTAGIQSGEYDVAQSISYDDVAQLESNTDVSLIRNTIGNYTVTLNKAEGVLADEKVRQAFSYAIDVNEIMAAVIPDSNYIDMYGSLMHKNSIFYSESGVSEYWNRHDVEKAKALLGEAGYKGEPVRLLSTQAYPMWVDGSLVLEKQLKEAGFAVDLQIYDWATVLDLKKQKDKFEGVLLWYPLVPVPTSLRVNSSVSEGWMNFEAVLDIFNQMNKSASLEQAADLWGDAQKVLLEKASVIPLGYASEPYGVFKDIKNYKTFLGMTIYGCYK